MTQNTLKDLHSVNTYQSWIEGQGIPIVKGLSVPNLKEVEVGLWERLGTYGAFIVLMGAEDTNNGYIIEMSAGSSVKPEHHMYEEIVYVLAGSGATTIWQDGGAKQTFEWHQGSLFAIPLNAWHQFFNGQGDQRARIYVVSAAPLVMNLYHNLDFLFNCGYVFKDRFDGSENFFSTEGQEWAGRIWETNIIKDVATLPLLDYKERGGGGLNMHFELTNSTLAGHVSQFPVGTYKNAHRHGAGANVIIVQGKGYSLLWQEGKESERVRVDWKPGSILSPPDMWFHQHFNVGAEPARYMAIRWGSLKYPLFKNVGSEQSKVHLSVKKGGMQIESEDEDPYIRQLFEEELTKNGVESRMATK